jgi:hypothetical protein
LEVWRESDWCEPGPAPCMRRGRSARLARRLHHGPDRKPAQVDQLRNGEKLAGKPQVNQDQLEMLAGNLYV